ncbi:hypothetical protein PHYBOEH_006811 [Phytophthora boehmeriae]|uniref:TFIIS N-terminal domain-containing protein n=1 Tax=Phytophthora boehmeriae TaxID=109152 RepID=A0A8T1WCF3_9STRA|nr:hypothetical protein PHYBOEH_006811 [Phytophthora boehmeriae]
MADVEIVPNSVGWYILEGFPWWPVYICDVFKLRPDLHLLGNGHKKILRKARDFPKDYIVVYYFGSHDFSLVSLKKGVLRPWDCPQKDSFLKGHPGHLAKKKGVMDELLEAIQEAEEYLSQPEDIRLPQHMVPSDLDPTLEPPPPELVPQEMDQDMEDMEDVEDEQDDEAFEEEGLDSDAEKEKKEKKEKKKTPKDKKDKKEKKSPKDKKDKKKEKKSRKTKSKDKDEHVGEAKKRKKVDDAAEHDETSPSKVAKTSTETDVKSEPAAVVEKVAPKKPPPADLSSEQLSIMLEKEIRWILVNCQFEEMTTKTVRKLLEDRLDMDLRHHKPSIKEGVARVIASMEEEDAVDPPPAGADESTPAAGPTTSDEPPAEASTKGAGNGVVAEAPAVKQEAVASADELALEKAEKERVAKQLQAAAKGLALDLEPNIMDALSSLKSLDAVDKDVLTESGLQPKLVQLRAHRSSNISELVSLLVKKWNVEDLVPAPKPITKEEILDLKSKLENSETPHDELFACLNQLSKMPLTISLLKKTEIPRVVSSLRQHGNDKVSSKAQNLRQSWMKLMKSDNAASSDANADPLKALKSLNRILEQRNDGASDHNKQLAALEQLHNMSLRTQDIIDSKVGVSVSKLRKSSNEKVAKMAKKLRKKWQAEANA